MNKMILRSVDILEYAANKLEGFRISDIMRDLEIPKSTTFDILYTLVACEMLEIKDEKHRIFALGPKTYDIGYNYIKDNSILDMAAPILKKLGDKLNKTVFMGKFDKNEVLYVYKYQPKSAVLNHCSINTRAGLYYTALGKSMLAFRKDPFDYESIQFERFTNQTLMSIPELLKDLELTRQRGYAVDNREIKDYMLCVAAPIIDREGDCDYAISVSTLYEDIDIEAIAEEVMASADLISKKIKYIT